MICFFLKFPVPFDEDDRDRSVWFLDHDYLENMYGMFKKVNGEFGVIFLSSLFSFVLIFWMFKKKNILLFIYFYFL